MGTYSSKLSEWIFHSFHVSFYVLAIFYVSLVVFPPEFHDDEKCCFSSSDNYIGSGLAFTYMSDLAVIMFIDMNNLAKKDTRDLCFDGAIGHTHLRYPIVPGRYNLSNKARFHNLSHNLMSSPLTKY